MGGRTQTIPLTSAQPTSEWLHALHRISEPGDDLAYRILVAVTGLVIAIPLVTGMHCWCKKRKSRKLAALRHRSRREARVQVRNSTRDKSIDSGSFDRDDWQERDQRSDGAIVLVNGENHYGMRFALSNPRATKSSLLAGFVLALVFGGERACAKSLSSAPYAADAHDQICNCGTRCRHESCCCGRGSATRGGSEESEPGSYPQVERRSGPCLGDAPCGDPGLPSSTPPSSSGRAAALALTAGIQPATTGNLLASTTILPPSSAVVVADRPSSETVPLGLISGINSFRNPDARGLATAFRAPSRPNSPARL